jgi:hypothetical protein
VVEAAISCFQDITTLNSVGGTWENQEHQHSERGQSSEHSLKLTVTPTG